MQPYIQTPTKHFPNPGLPPLGFPARREEFTNYLPSYKGPTLDKIVYKLPGLTREKMILPGNINSQVEDYKPTTLESILFN